MYVVLEGGECTGKSTLAQTLSANLVSQGLDVCLTKEPGSLEDTVCQSIREVILDPKHDVSDKAALLLFCADRAQHINKVVKPALNEGKIVISDRSSLSTVVYHIAKLMIGTSEKISDDYFYEIVDFAQEISPDCCFVANADWKWTKEQLLKRNRLDRIERFGDKFHKNVHALFEEFSSNQLCMLHPLASKIRTYMHTFPKKMYKLPKTNNNSSEELADYISEILKKNLHESSKERS